MIRLGFVGDVMPGGEFLYHGHIDKRIKDMFGKFDLRIANLESAICDGKTKCHIKINDPKLGNIIFSPEEAICVLKELNINVVSLANNHVCDCDLEGLKNTIEILDKNGIVHFGAGRTKKEAEQPAFIRIKDKSFCFLGYFPPNWEAPYPPTEKNGGLNHFYIDKIISDIERYKKECDYLFVLPHWGKEYTRLPFVSDVIYAKQIIEAGATAVIGSHTHIVQSVLKYKKGLIAMSLGNFIFPDRWIVPPRMTYYPSEEERNLKKHPVVYGFPIVNELSYKKVDDANREGVVLSVDINEQNVEYNLTYTKLDYNHYLNVSPLKTLERIKLMLLALVLKDSRTFLYRFYCRFYGLYGRAISKMKRILKVNHA